MIPEEVQVIAEALAGFYQLDEVDRFYDCAWAIYNKLQKPRNNLRSVL